MTLSALGIFSAAGAGGPAFTDDYQLISTTILSSSQPSITFDVSGVPSTYRHLQIRAAARFSFADFERGMYLRLNGDTGNNYAFHHLYSVGGSSLASFALASQNSIAVGSTPAASATSNAYGAMVLDILDAFSTTKNKTIRVLSGSAGPGVQNWVALMSGVRLNTNAITTITLSEPSTNSNFVAGSRFSIYGIRG